MSRPSVGSSSTSRRASIAMIRARCNWVTMPFDSSRILLERGIAVLAKKASAWARWKRGCTPATKSRACETRIQRGSTATSAMKEASRMSRSRSRHGSRPSTRSSPPYGVRPRMALSAVVLPAPLGPMSPRMRPSSRRRSMLSSATVVPKTLRSAWASMQGMASTLLLGLGIGRVRIRGAGLGGLGWRGGLISLAGGSVEEFFRLQAQPLNGGVDPGPLFGEKFVAFALQQQASRTGVDEHAEPPAALDQALVYQLLIALQDRERIDSILRRHRAHGGQRIAFLEHAVEDHRDHAIAKLTVNRLTVVPLAVHLGFLLMPLERTLISGSRAASRSAHGLGCRPAA